MADSNDGCIFKIFIFMELFETNLTVILVLNQVYNRGLENIEARQLNSF